MKIIYHGHSFIEIVLKTWSVLIDPFITWNPFTKTNPEKICEKKIISVILTHWHDDHIWNTEEICKKTGCKLISTFEIIQYFWNEKWLKNLHAMHIWWEYDFEDYKVKLTPANHWWWVADLKSGYTTLPAWVIVRAEWKNIYHAWDTGLTYDMKLLWDYDKIDIAFLPIWWNFTMWIDDAVIAAKDFIKAKKVIPIHYNTFWIIKANPKEFVRKIIKNWIDSEEIIFWEGIDV